MASPAPPASPVQAEVRKTKLQRQHPRVQRRNLRERKSWEDNVGKSVVGGEGEKRGEVDPRRGLRKRSSWIPSGISFARPFHRSHGGSRKRERKRGKGKKASRRSGDMDKVGYPRKVRARIPLGFFIAAPQWERDDSAGMLVRIVELACESA